MALPESVPVPVPEPISIHVSFRYRGGPINPIALRQTPITLRIASSSPLDLYTRSALQLLIRLDTDLLCHGVWKSAPFLVHSHATPYGRDPWRVLNSAVDSTINQDQSFPNGPYIYALPMEMSFYKSHRHPVSLVPHVSLTSITNTMLITVERSIGFTVMSTPSDRYICLRACLYSMVFGGSGQVVTGAEVEAKPVALEKDLHVSDWSAHVDLATRVPITRLVESCKTMFDWVVGLFPGSPFAHPLGPVIDGVPICEKIYRPFVDACIPTSIFHQTDEAESFVSVTNYFSVFHSGFFHFVHRLLATKTHLNLRSLIYEPCLHTPLPRFQLEPLDNHHRSAELQLTHTSPYLAFHRWLARDPAPNTELAHTVCPFAITADIPEIVAINIKMSIAVMLAVLTDRPTLDERDELDAILIEMIAAYDLKHGKYKHNRRVNTFVHQPIAVGPKSFLHHVPMPLFTYDCIDWRYIQKLLLLQGGNGSTRTTIWINRYGEEIKDNPDGINLFPLSEAPLVL